MTDHIHVCSYFARLHQVNLYSDPPKPGHSVQSGSNRDTSKFMTLDFPQAQRAEINSASLHPDGHSTHQGTFILIDIYHFQIHSNSSFYTSYKSVNQLSLSHHTVSHCSSDLLLYVQLNIAHTNKSAGFHYHSACVV